MGVPEIQIRARGLVVWVEPWVSQPARTRIGEMTSNGRVGGPQIPVAASRCWPSNSAKLGPMPEPGM